MSAEISNPFSTGGGGQFFEAKVQASFLLNLLIGGCVPCFPTGKIISVRLQAKQAGFHTDDINVLVRLNTGTEQRLLAQIKHHITITASDAEFEKALESAWLDFNNKTLFVQDRDVIALITGPLPNQVIEHVRPLLDWARTSANSEEFVSKINTARFSSESKRAYFKVFKDVIEKITKTVLADDLLWRFLRQFYLLSYDFDAQGGKDEAALLTVLNLARNHQSNLDAQAIWEALIIQAQEWNKTAGTYTESNLPDRIKSAVQSNGSPAQKEAFNKLKEHCAFVLDSIQTALSQTIKLPRTAILDALVNAVESSRIVVVQGAAGSGKSAIVKMLFEALPNSIIPFAFKAQEFNQPHLHQFLSSMGITLSMEQLRCEFGLLPRKVLLIDGAERLFEISNHEAFRHLLQELSKDVSWTVVITCRESSAQELREHMLAQWGADITPITVPPLTLEELLFLADKAPQLGPLIVNQRLMRLLCLPYILSLVLETFPTSSSAKTASDVDEGRFKDMVWDRYVERVGQIPGPLRINRGQCLISISVERAKRMSLFVPPQDRNAEALNSLIDDGILIRSSVGNFAPAHDVLEDWAVSRFIAQEFEKNSGNPKLFVEAIGIEPAMRRSFRQWLSEALANSEKKKIIDFILSSFSCADFSQIWRDEISVSVLQSDNAGELIRNVENLLLGDNKTLYRRLVHVLRTACKGPNEALLRNFGIAAFQNHAAVKTIFIIPTGSGWSELILFTYRHLESFNFQDAKIILGLLRDWSQGIDTSALPPEAEAAAKICFKFLELFAPPDSYVDKMAEEFLEILFKVPHAVPEQIEKLIRSALDGQFAGKAFSRTIFERVLKSLECRSLCEHFPKLVIEVAEKAWFSRERHRARYRTDIGEMFGFRNSLHSEYFPESALQGPFTFLLLYHPELAIDFIVRLINDSAQAYSQSALSNETHQVSLVTRDGNHTVLASPRLWVLYRGMMPGPNVFGCALMALESWLLNRAKEGKDVQGIFRTILQSSSSVATLSVLASVAVAYPQSFGEDVLFLLQTKEFYRWDFQRSVQEKSHTIDVRAMMGIPTGGAEEFYYQERKQQSDLPHRTSNLEHLAGTLQFTPLREKVFKILDEFKNALPPESNQDKEDKSWRIAIHRMDTRHFKETPGKEPGEVFLTPSAPAPDLQLHIDIERAGFEPIEKRMRLALWGSERFERKAQPINSFPNWRDALREAQLLEEKDADLSDERLLGRSCGSFVAAVLIRDHYSELEQNDVEWCRRVIIQEIIKKDLGREWNARYSRDPFDGSRPSAYVLPLLLKGDLSKPIRKSIEACLAVAVTHTNEEVRDYAVAGIREWLWNLDPLLAKSCVGGAFFLGNASNQIRKELRAKRVLSETEEETKIVDAIRKLRIRIVKRDTVHALKNATVNLETVDWPELLDALMMIQPATTDNDLKALIMTSLQALISEAESNETGKTNDRSQLHYDFRHSFAKLFARFILSRPAQEVEPIAEILCKCIDRCPEYLDDLIAPLPFEYDRNRADFGTAFWTVWKKVSKPVFEHRLLRGPSNIWGYQKLRTLVRILLFADIKWADGVREWSPVTENREFFKTAAEVVGPTKVGFGALLSLFSTVGRVFLPDAIIWLSQAFEKSPGIDLLDDIDSAFLLEVVLRKTCYEIDTDIRQRPELHRATLALLNQLVERGSHTGFRLRDYIVTPLPPSVQ